MTESQRDQLSQSKWTGRLIQWTILIGLAFLPFLNLILLRGWRIKVVEKMGTSRYFFTSQTFKEYFKEFLSSIKNLPIFFLKGAILWITHWIYWIPLIIFFLILGTELFSTFWDLIVLGLKSLVGISTESFDEVLESSKNNILIISISVIVYYFLYWPIFRAGMIRYSVEGKFRYLFQVGPNIKFAQKYFRYFMPACIYATLVELFLFNLIFGISFFIPFISYVVVVVILLPAIYSTTAYIYGTLARKIYKP